MTDRFDTAKIVAENKLSDIIGKCLPLKKDGNEWRACCPFHEESTPSFTVYPGKKGAGQQFKCFGCGEHGNVIDFVMKWERCDFKRACELLGGEKKLRGASLTKHAAEPEVNPYDDYEMISPVPAAVPALVPGQKTPPIFNPKRDEAKAHNPTLVHPYRNAAGELLGYVLRIDVTPEGGKPYKITPSLAYVRRKSTGKEGWCLMRPQQGGAELNPLYGADKLQANPDAMVLVVEGEKSADRGQELLPDMVVVSWMGGTNGARYTDWSGLQGRRVVIMPDNDAPGLAVAQEIGDVLVKIGAASVRVLDPDPQNKVKGWDIADAVEAQWTAEFFKKWAKERVRDHVPTGKKKAEPEIIPALQIEVKVMPPADDVPPADDTPGFVDVPPEYDDGHRTVPTKDTPRWPFRILGYNRNTYYYLPYANQQILPLTATQHSKMNLADLASAQFWENEFGHAAKGDKVYFYAANALLQEAKRKGLFDPAAVLRGRGAWEDETRRVVHVGDKVYIDGKPYMPAKAPSGYVYECGMPIGINPNDPATNKEANALVEVCRMLNWEKPRNAEFSVSAELLAGFCIIAPVCGILPWRSHIWITGNFRSGKSTVLKKVVQPVMGKMTLPVFAGSTEASIRQTLLNDARPITYEEAEPDKEENKRLMSGILELVRISSDGATVTKGGGDGKTTTYQVRSCFCLVAINPTIETDAEDSRICKLVIMKDTREDAPIRYREFLKLANSTFTKAYSERMLARTMKHMDVLLDNITLIQEVCQDYFADGRIGDQLAPMIAGYMLCHTTKRVKREDIEKYLRERNWSSYTVQDAEQDQYKMINYISIHQIRVDYPNGTKSETIGELLERIKDNFEVCDRSSIEAKTLRRLGILFTRTTGMVDIAKDNPPLTRILARTAWKSSWYMKLSQVEGSEKTKNSIYFGGGFNTGRGWSVPVSHFLSK